MKLFRICTNPDSQREIVFPEAEALDYATRKTLPPLSYLCR
jgi:hypothetical protein